MGREGERHKQGLKAEGVVGTKSRIPACWEPMQEEHKLKLSIAVKELERICLKTPTGMMGVGGTKQKLKQM